MDIHVVSTLTSEDEDRVADALIAALAELLDGLPIAYALRIETTGTKVVQVRPRSLDPRSNWAWALTSSNKVYNDDD